MRSRTAFLNEESFDAITALFSEFCCPWLQKDASIVPQE